MFGIEVSKKSLGFDYTASLISCIDLSTAHSLGHDFSKSIGVEVGNCILEPFVIVSPVERRY
jgi:hypothetical protein